MDLFGRGTFTGKGLYDVDAFTRHGRQRVPRQPHPQPRPDRVELRRAAPGHRRRGLRRVPRALPRLRPARPPLGPRRLATAALARPAPCRCPTARGPPTSCPGSSAGRSSITCAAACCPPASSRCSSSGGTVLPGPRLGWLLAGAVAVPRCRPTLYVLQAGAPARRPARRRAPSSPGPGPTSSTPPGRRRCRSSSPPTRPGSSSTPSSARSTGCSVSRRHLLEWETAAATEKRLGSGLGMFVGDHVAGLPDRRRRRRRWSGCVAPDGLVRPRAGVRRLAALAAGRLGASAPAPARRRRRCPPQTGARAAPHHAQDLGLLRDVRRRRGQLAAAGQLPGGAARHRRPPHLADEHGAVPARDAGGPRPRLPGHAGHDRPARATRSTPSTSSSATAGTSSTGTRRPRWRRCRPAYVSTVDSGNLLACLLALANGLVEKARLEPARRPLAGAARHARSGRGRVGAAARQGLRRGRARPSPTLLRATATPWSRRPGEATSPRAGRACEPLADEARRGASTAAVGDPTAPVLRWAGRLVELARRHRAGREAEAGEARGVGARPRRPGRAGPRLRRRRWTSASSTTRTANCSRSATTSPPAGSTRRTTTCSPPRRASPASSPSPAAQVPRKHWFQLGRLATRAAGDIGLVSWGGTMFEYLMPRLLLPVPPGVLLDQAQKTAVRRQIQFGRECGLPWGVSESGLLRLRRRAGLPVPVVRRARPRPQARPRPRPRHRPLRDAARRRRLPASRPWPTSPASARRAARGRTASSRRSTTRPRACPRAGATRSCAPTWPTTRAWASSPSSTA